MSVCRSLFAMIGVDHFSMTKVRRRYLLLFRYNQSMPFRSARNSQISCVSWGHHSIVGGPKPVSCVALGNLSLTNTQMQRTHSNILGSSNLDLRSSTQPIRKGGHAIYISAQNEIQDNNHKPIFQKF